LSINDIMGLRDRVEHFVTTVLNLALVLEGVKNCLNLRDVIYGRPQTNVIKKETNLCFF
jgi:hypothetical protein